MPDQEWNVLLTLPKRWEVNREDVQAVVEVCAEPVLPHGLSQVSIRGSDHPYFDLYRARAPYPLEFPLLESPEELRLQLQRQVADFVRK
jgi:hypothetical protein